MILGIDVGNSNIVVAIMDESGVQKKKNYETDRKSSSIYYKKQLKELVEDNNIKDIIISSVVPEMNETLSQAILEAFRKKPIFVKSNLDLGITIKYDNPNKLGADLITVGVSAVTKYDSPVIVIDVGTATTFSVINGKKEYLGGMIAPGPYTSIKALATMTSQLPEIEFTEINKVIGTNTIDCIKIGTITAHAAMIDGMLEKVLNRLNEPNVKIIATGGNSKRIIEMCIHKIIWDENLIFDGLYEIYRRNKNLPHHCISKVCGGGATEPCCLHNKSAK